jgi:hypothetical protein
LPLLLGDSPFERFLRFSDWLFARTGQTHALAQERLVHLLHEYLCALPAMDADVADALIADYRGTGGRSRLRFETGAVAGVASRGKKAGSTPSRQARHLQTLPRDLSRGAEPLAPWLIHNPPS